MKISILLISLLFSFSSFAEESAADKIENNKNKVVDSVKGTYRDVKDKACEMINGKLECLGKKIINKTKTLSEKTATKVTEIKNKAEKN